jgi:hypothetical protein
MSARAAALATLLLLTQACAHVATHDTGRSVTLFFGRDSPAGLVTQEAFEAFEAEVITQALPDGYTILEARGRYREPEGALISEPTFVLVVVATDADALDAMSARVDAIRVAYCTRFAQTSVLRVDAPARVSFTP